MTGVAPAAAGVYERGAWRVTADGLRRPGGLALTDRAVAACGLRAGDPVLDVGCGTGVTVAHLVDRHGLAARGVDASPALIAEGRLRRPDLVLTCGPAGNLPDPDGAFAAAFLECSWSAGGGDASAGAVLGEVARVVRRGGHVVVMDLYSRQPASQASYPLGAGCWAALPGEDDVRARLESAGFRVVTWEDHAGALAAFVAQVTLAGGSLDALLGSPDSPIDRAALRVLRPGYFLAVATRS